MSVLSRVRIWFQSKNLKYEFNSIRRFYSFKLRKENVPVLVISCLDSRTSSHGFADRLKGMISCYAYAKAIDVPFRIEHIDPFDLSDYLIPNHYDWGLKPNEKSMNLWYVRLCFFICTVFGYHSLKFLRISRSRQQHLFTNLDYLNDINKHFKKDYRFNELFSELFKPSAVLETELISHKRALTSSGGFISVSFRVMQLMGDFKDYYGEVLPEKEKIKLTDKSLSVIQQLHEKEHKRVFVTSDSQLFLEEAAKLDFVYVAPGKIGHIGYSKDGDVYLKMFVDFILISQADHVYLAYSGKMYNSSFARTAALSGGVPFDVILY